MRGGAAVLAMLFLAGCVQPFGIPQDLPDATPRPGLEPGDSQPLDFDLLVSLPHRAALGPSHQFAKAIGGTGVPEGYTLVWTHLDAEGNLIERLAGWEVDLQFREWGRHWVVVQLFRPDGTMAAADEGMVLVDGKLESNQKCPNPSAGCPTFSFAVPLRPTVLWFQGSLQEARTELDAVADARLEVRDAAGDLVAIMRKGELSASSSTEGFDRSANWTMRWVGRSHLPAEATHSVEVHLSMFPEEPRPPVPVVDLEDWPTLPIQALKWQVFTPTWSNHEGNRSLQGNWFTVECSNPSAVQSSANARLEIALQDAEGTELHRFPTMAPCHGHGRIPEDYLQAKGPLQLAARLTWDGQILEGSVPVRIRSFFYHTGSCAFQANLLPCGVAKLQVPEGVQHVAGSLGFHPAAGDVVELRDGDGALVEQGIQGPDELRPAWSFRVEDANTFAPGEWTVTWRHGPDVLPGSPDFVFHAGVGP